MKEFLRSQKQDRKELRIAGKFLEFLQNEGFPFECDDFDVVYDTSLDHKDDTLEPDFQSNT